MSMAEIPHPRKTLPHPPKLRAKIQYLLERIWLWLIEWWHLFKICFLELARTPRSRIPKKDIYRELCHQRHSATKLPEGRSRGKLPATGHCWLLCITGTGKWSCEYFIYHAGHWVLVVTMHCRSQALENLRVLQDPGAGESCVWCRNLLSGHNRARKKNRFPSCNVSPVPSTGKASVPAGKGKIFFSIYFFIYLNFS